MKTAPTRVIVTGSLGYDYIMDFPGLFADRIMPDKIHKISLSFLVETLKKQRGGTAGNIAYSLKLLGFNPQILACAGNDFAEYAAALKKYRISTSGIDVHSDVTTSSYFVVTDTEDNQIGSFYGGAMRYAKDIDLGKTATDKDFVVISPTDPEAMQRYVAWCREHNVSYLYDPAFQIATFSPEALRKGIEGAQILIGNDYEIALIEEKLEVSHDDLLLLSPVVVTTLGNKGSIIETVKDSIHIKPAKAKRVIDPTGAGDAYRAGFVAGFVRGQPLDVCGQIGSIAAVYAIEHYGTQAHTYTKEAFRTRYTSTYFQTLKI